MKYDSFYNALAMQAAAEENTVPDMPEHRFSRKYEHEKKLLIKAYEKSQSHNESVAGTFRKLHFRRKIQVAVLIVLSILLLTGAGVYITHRFGDITAKQYWDHSIAHVEVEGAPEKIVDRYEIGYDLSGLSKEVIADNEFHYWEEWTDEGIEIEFSYKVKHGLTTAMNTEGSTVTNVTINGHEGVYFMTPNETHFLIWDNGDYLFEMLFTGIDYETGIEIAESVRKV